MLPLLFLAVLFTLEAPAVDSLLEDVRRLTAAENNEARFDALAAMLRARNLPYSIQPFTIDKPVGREPRTEGRNVIVTLGDGRETIVVGAHYDAARLPDGSLSRGAVDNAASSVILVRLAEALSAEHLPVRVKVVWFDMEELGLIGSQQYITLHGTDRLMAMLNFDVNGYGDTVVYGPSERHENRRLRQALLDTCAAEARNCVAFPQMPPSDDRSFVSAKVPAVSIAALPAMDVHQLWLMMNAKQDSGLVQGYMPSVLRTIHTTEDTVAKIDVDTMSRMLQFAHALLREVVQSSARSAQ